MLGSVNAAGVATVRKIAATLAFALCLPGCGSAAPSVPPGEPVPLLTGALGCYAGGEGGPTARLIVDPNYGTSFDGQPVMWPLGYTARRAGSEVVILDTQGRVKATTGRSYHISHAFAYDPNDDGTFNGLAPNDLFPAAAECGYHWDFIDCTANPTDSYCLPHEPERGPSPTPPQPPP